MMNTSLFAWDKCMDTGIQQICANICLQAFAEIQISTGKKFLTAVRLVNTGLLHHIPQLKIGDDQRKNKFCPLFQNKLCLLISCQTHDRHGRQYNKSKKRTSSNFRLVTEYMCANFASSRTILWDVVNSSANTVYWRARS